ncbi:MAG: hypothetical protein COT09_03455 [Candidatus Hydromicrobium americanum]|nr:MAG: hypothetical protein COT09_03455 [Candidatus Hydromicrobium americanum]
MDRLSVVKVFNSRIEAEIAKSYLESFGIKTEIFSDDAGQSIASLQSIRGVKLLTNRKDLQKARRLLDKKNLSNE